MTKTLATTNRILRQLGHDPHTIALALLVPTMLMVLLRFVFQNQPHVFHNIAPIMLGIFPFVLMFIISSISMLRERTVGTLERLLTLPINKFQIIAGYAIAFGMLALAQAALASMVTIGLLGVRIVGGGTDVLIVAVIGGILGMTFGLFASSLARSEFQVVQFFPAMILPQLLVCGLFIAKDQMARPLQWLAEVTPLPYVVDAMKTVVTTPNWPVQDLLIIGVFFIGSLVLAATSIHSSK
jgi:ABC-2 type transport system permease protein